MSAHNATAYPVESTSPHGPPINTEGNHGIYLNTVWNGYNRAKLKVYSQFRQLTGVPDPTSLPPGGMASGPALPSHSSSNPKPTMDDLKADIITWLQDAGHSMDAGFDSWTKAELLELVQVTPEHVAHYGE